MCPSFCNRHRGANGFERCSALFGQTLPIQLDGALVECSACCNSSCRSQIIFSFDLRNEMKLWSNFGETVKFRKKMDRISNERMQGDRI